MICCEGQGLLGKVDFKNGTPARYARPYLVVSTDNNGVYLVDVSSTKGKEHKLIFNSNYELEQYNPPFVKPSFVKLDSKRYVSYEKLSSCRVVSNGKCLNEKDLSQIKGTI